MLVKNISIYKKTFLKWPYVFFSFEEPVSAGFGEIIKRPGAAVSLVEAALAVLVAVARVSRQDAFAAGAALKLA